jgi:hypothetical protein
MVDMNHGFGVALLLQTVGRMHIADEMWSAMLNT